ncbi:MAG: bifunctional diaminohydroxyphosphoribosylaminopyrimidine deaminase/5-amino-6-(5-phosphoribosylamino)uracil reductase RibD [Luminiphilus sp.]|nr:bifunctional diaminohydroxyphosphoribosylaminopyrimidine deaminase/5-amino-6-(5-phosphoribosylamino)uracil reductase RibD [Luminiphilus sp.]
MTRLPRSKQILRADIAMRHSDEKWMAEAIKVGRQARVWSAPNPAVGCVIVRDDELLAAGFTHPTGQQHAEIHALSQIDDAAGATAYVTLEPCSHTGHTGPCVDALIGAGIVRVVLSCVDPDPRVAGKGVAKLESAGLDVTTGVLEAQAHDELKGFFLRLSRGWGRVTVKMAISADGRSAMASGESQWITGPAARADVQAWRAESDVILTGSGTVMADDCALTLRQCENRLSEADWQRALAKPTARAVVDSSATITHDAKVVGGDTPTFLFVRSDAQASTDMPSSVSYIPLDTQEKGVDLKAVFKLLGDKGANEILVEAGPTLVGALQQADLIDQWLIYMAPTMLGADARPAHAAVFKKLSDAPRYSVTGHELIGDDLRIIMRAAQDS